MMSLTCSRWLISLLLAAAIAAPASAADDYSSFALDLVMLTIPADPDAPMAVVGAEPGQPANKRSDHRAMVWLGVHEVRFGELVLTFEEGIMRWNGEPDPPAGSGVQQLIQRRVSLLTGQPTEIRAIVDDLHYFEETKDGLYRMKSVSKRDLPGLLLNCEAEGYRELKGTGLVEFDYKLRLVVVESREELPGAPNQLGKPRMARFKLSRSEELQSGAWHLVSGHLVSDTGTSQGAYLLVLIRISRVE